MLSNVIKVTLIDPNLIAIIQPTELETLIQDERLLQEEINYEETNLAELKQLMVVTKEAIAREKQ